MQHGSPVLYRGRCERRQCGPARFRDRVAADQRGHSDVRGIPCHEKPQSTRSRFVYQTDDVRVELWANTPEEMAVLHQIFGGAYMCECDACNGELDDELDEGDEWEEATP